jgi:hypothetical protein
MDISVNRLTGKLDMNQKESNERPTKLRTDDFILRANVNRFSGRLGTNSFNFFDYLEVLDGNLFSCEDLPSNDVHSDRYSCGSYVFVSSLVFMALSTLFLVMTYYMAHIVMGGSTAGGNKEDETVTSAGHLSESQTQEQCANSDILEDSGMSSRVPLFHAMVHWNLFTSFFETYVEAKVDLKETYIVFQELQSMLSLIIQLVVVSIVMCVPIYALKGTDVGDLDGNYATHYETYLWFYSIAYVSGSLPVIFILLCWFVLVMVLYKVYLSSKGFCFNNYLQCFRTGIIFKEKVTMTDRVVFKAVGDVEVKSIAGKDMLKVYLGCIVDIIVFGTVNGVYVYSSYENNEIAGAAGEANLIFIQILMSLFFVSSRYVLIPIVLKPLLKDTHRYNSFRLFLLLTNYLLIPFCATLFTLPSCFRNIFVDGDSKVSSYTYDECAILDATTNLCTTYVSTTIDVPAFVAPFTFNYACSSTILTVYLPIVVYTYGILLLSSLLYFLVFSSVSYSSLPNFMKISSPGILWPEYFRETEGGKHRDSAFDFCSRSSVDNPIIDRENATTPHNKFPPLESSSSSSPDENGESFAEWPQHMINFKVEVVDIMYQIAVLFTFGMCSPLLGICILIYLAICITSWRTLIGRFLFYVCVYKEDDTFVFKESNVDASKDGGSNQERSTSPVPCFRRSTVRDVMGLKEREEEVRYRLRYHPCAIKLNRDIVEVTAVFDICFWQIVVTSALFYSFILWEMNADKAGGHNSIWVPCVVMSIPLLLYIISVGLQKYHSPRPGVSPLKDGLISPSNSSHTFPDSGGSNPCVNFFRENAYSNGSGDSTCDIRNSGEATKRSSVTEMTTRRSSYLQ